MHRLFVRFILLLKIPPHHHGTHASSFENNAFAVVVHASFARLHFELFAIDNAIQSASVRR